MQADALSQTFAALADPTRRAILARVSLGETSVSELAKPFDMSLPAISKHLTRAELAKLCDPANYLGQSGVMVDRVLSRVRPAA